MLSIYTIPIGIVVLAFALALVEDSSISTSTSSGLQTKRTCSFALPSDYDFSLSTSDNYELKRRETSANVAATTNVESSSSSNYFYYDVNISTEKDFFVLDFNDRYGKYRSRRDYTYHTLYNRDRVDFQNCLLDTVLATVNTFSCQTKDDNSRSDLLEAPDTKSNKNESKKWLVFTAGAMGSGKSFILNYFNEMGVFPLDDFVRVDPDTFREAFPEAAPYYYQDPDTAGRLTQKETGLLAEMLIDVALDQSLNVLVDGSLRDSNYYSSYINSLKRGRFGEEYMVGIIYVHVSDVAIAKKRSRQRESQILRRVPEHLIEETYTKVYKSIELLSPLSHAIVTVQNDGVLPRILNISLSNNEGGGGGGEMIDDYDNSKYSFEGKDQDFLYSVIKETFS